MRRETSQGLKLVAPLVRKLGPKANPAILKTIPVKSYLLWAFYAGERCLCECREMRFLLHKRLHF